jgi:hypothetical protein
MFTQAPEIIIDATIGSVVVAPTATPTPTATSFSTATPTPIYTYTPTPTPTATTISLPTLPPIKRYKQNALIIYGYGPKQAEVTLKGFGVSEKTISDDSGLFIFGGIYSLTPKYPELCVQAVDNEKRVTQSSCIPALPDDSLIPLEVGPILLSPTISVSDNKVEEGQEVILSGKTIPSSNVNVFLAKKENNFNRLSFVKETYAYTLPELTIKANSDGEYNITLPTTDSAEYTIFTSSKFGGDLTNKSNTLDFVVLTKLKTYIEKLIEFLLQNKILAVIMLEILVFVILFLNALKSTKRGKKRHSESDYLEFTKILS